MYIFNYHLLINKVIVKYLTVTLFLFFKSTKKEL